MAEVFVKHTLNPHKTIKFNLNLRDYVIKGEEGEYKWVLEIGTTALTASGTKTPVQYIHKVSEDSLEDEIEAAISRMCSLMDWTEFDVDRYPPWTEYFYPQGDNVPIRSVVSFKVVEKHPSSGIDLSNLNVTFNNGDVDFDITSEMDITGDPYEYTISWVPPKING